LIFECQAFASVRTSVAMVVGMEVRVVGHNTVRQSAQRLGLFFRGMYIASLIERPIGAAPAAPTGSTQPDKYASGLRKMRATAFRSYVGDPT
jgi:hypothetical protein